MSGESHQELFRRGTEAPASRMLLAGVVLAAVGSILFVLQITGDDPARGWRVLPHRGGTVLGDSRRSLSDSLQNA